MFKLGYLQQDGKSFDQEFPCQLRMNKQINVKSLVRNTTTYESKAYRFTLNFQFLKS